MSRHLAKLIAWSGLALIGSLIVVLDPGLARAYPQWQFTSGAVRCNQCHYAPGGGGLITGYGRDAVGDELSTFTGEGAFLHGVVSLPSRVALQADLRGALLARDGRHPDAAPIAAFPMQADLQGRVSLPAGLSVAGIVGLRGQVRDDSAFVPMENYQPITASRVISREHHVTWQPANLGPYARLGKFFAPYGLRLAEHVTYVRRDLGFNLMEESYNLSAGYVKNEWEAHLTAFAPDVLRRIGGNETGLAAYYERRMFDGRGAVAGQSRLAFGPGRSRLAVGAVGKYHVELLRTLFLAEANLVGNRYDTELAGTRAQLVGAAGFAVLPVRGLMLTMLGERNQGDLGVRNTAWNAATFLLNWFPYPHVELQVASQLQFASGGQSARLLLGQLHYFM